MAKLTLNDVQSGYQSKAAVNANNAAIEAALENTLSRDGTGPNQMNSDLDMNGHALLNLLATSGGVDFNFIGEWTTGYAYSANNLVYVTIAEDATNGGATYIALTDHTSGTFATDLASNYWTLLAARGEVGASGAGSGDLVAAQNLSDVSNVNTARDNLGAIEDVLTTEGDLLVEGAAGPERLAVGSDGQVLTSDGTDPVWSSLFPVGAIMDYAGTSAPTGWLFSQGQSVSRTTYANLFTAIGTTYGTEDGNSFTLPDLRGRVIAGKDDMGGVSADRLTGLSGGVDGDTLGATGGAQSVALSAANHGSHTHTFSATSGTGSANHTHTVPASTSTVQILGGYAMGTDSGGSTGTVTTSSSGAAHTHSVNGTTSAQGSGTAHNNVQPTFILNKIIKY